MRHWRPSRLCLPVILALLLGCSSFYPPAYEVPPSAQPQLDKWGCTVPAQLVALNKNELELASVKYGKFSLGDLKLTNDPQLKQILSQGASNAAVVDYLKCGQIARGELDPKDEVQAAYQQKILFFSTSNPSSEEWRKFFQENPPPSKLTSNGNSETSMIRSAKDLWKEFHAVIDGRKPPYKESDFARVKVLIEAIQHEDQTNGHALYYSGEVKRQLGMLEESHGDFFKYIEIERTLPENERLGDTGSETCYKRAKGYCRQRTGWIWHLLANDFYDKARKEKNAATKTVFSEKSLQYAQASLDSFPDGFIQFTPTKTIMEKLRKK